jgi:Secretion system C-terminal sorting domain
MNKYSIIKTIIVICCIIIGGSRLSAQISGVNGYVKGDFVEVGFAGGWGYEGAFISSGSLPLGYGYHQRLSGPGVYAVMANPQMNNWTAPNFDGDFFGMFTQQNGWGFEIKPYGGDNAAVVSNNIGYPRDLSGYMENFIVNPFSSNVEWASNYDTLGYDLDFLIRFSVNKNDLYYTTSVTITNNGTDTINEFYYYRTGNPDNNASITGQFATQNTVEEQPGGPSVTAKVSASDTTGWNSYIAFVGHDANFRASVGLSEYRSGYDWWNGGPEIYTTEDFSITEDLSITIAYRILDFLPGTTRTFQFHTVFAPNIIPDEIHSVYGTYANAGNVISNILSDTVYACDTLSISLKGYLLANHAWSWLPNTYLNTDTGTAVSLLPLDTITYVVTGVGLDTIQFNVTVFPAKSPKLSITDPGPQCGTYDLNTLVFADLESLPSVAKYFLDDEPVNGFDLTTLFSSTLLTPFDSVFLMLTDTLTGCYDYDTLDIVWNDVLFNISGTTTACTSSTGMATVYDFSNPPASILWSNGSTTAIATALPLGMATVTVTSASGCDRTDSIYIPENTFTMDLDVLPEGCGNVNGIVTVSYVSDTSDTYSYLWNTGDTTYQIDSLPGNNMYFVTVTNQDGCFAMDSVFVDSVTSVFDITIWSYEASCDTCPNGAVYVMVGSAPYGMTVIDSVTGDTLGFFNSYAAGTYTLIATDGIGCTQTYYAEVGWFFWSVAENAEPNFRVFPNPVHQDLQINALEKINGICVTGVDGRIVLETKPLTNSVKIDVSSLVNGVYMLQIHTGNDTKTLKFLKL